MMEDCGCPPSGGQLSAAGGAGTSRIGNTMAGNPRDYIVTATRIIKTLPNRAGDIGKRRLKEMPCMKLLKGRCADGDACMFAHSSTAATKDTKGSNSR